MASIARIFGQAGRAQQRVDLPKYARDKAGCDSYQLIHREFLGPITFEIDAFPTTSHAFSFSDETPDGFYRWLVGISAGVTPGNGVSGLAFHLVPPMARQFIEPFKANPPLAFFIGITNVAGIKRGGAFAPTIASVKIDTGDFSTNASQNEVSVDSVGGLPLAVPAGWRILAWDDVNGNSVPFLFLRLRMMYYEIPLGKRPPTVTRQL